jgi:hypothetical protein
MVTNAFPAVFVLVSATAPRFDAEMTNAENPFFELDLQQAIDLRWTLRDIRAKRWVLSPINPLHLERLIAMGLVEMRDDNPVLTNAGADAIA